MVTLEETRAFQKALLENNGYTTPSDYRPKALGGFDFYYYLRFIGFLLGSNRGVNAQPGYPLDVWSSHSLSFMRIVEDCGGRIVIEGVEHRKALGRPAVYIGNHMSLIEAFLIPAVLLPFDRVAAVAKESLMHYPLLGAVARGTEPISVKRENPREDLKAVLEQGKRFLEEGRSVVLFPQATRSAQFDRRKFNSLGVKLAERAKAPIIPLAVKTDFQTNGSLIKDIGPLDRSKTVHMRLGEAFFIEDSAKAANERVMDFIESSLAEWRAKS